MMFPKVMSVLFCLLAALCISAGGSLAGGPLNERLLIVGCAPPGSAVGWVVGGRTENYPTILHTKDGGSTWTPQGRSDTVPVVNFTGVHAVDDCTAWAVGESACGYGSIVHTTDGGLTWLRQGDASQIPDLELSGVYAIDSKTAWVTGFDGLILKTTDGGKTWKRQGQDAAPSVILSGVYAADKNHVWVVGYYDNGYGTILHSSNGGQDWVRQKYTPRAEVMEPYLITCHGLDAKTVWAVGRNTALMTTDGGQSWQDKTPYGGIGPYDLNGIYAVSGKAAWLVTDSDGIYFYDGTGWEQQKPSVFGHYLLRVSGLGKDNVWISGAADTYSATPGVILNTTTGSEPWNAQEPGVQTDLWGISFVKSPPLPR